MRNFLLILFFILLSFLQLALMPKLSFFSFTPDLVLAAVVGYGVSRQESKNYWLILIPALFLDLLSGFPFGLLTLSLWLSFFLVEILSRTFFPQGGAISGMLAPIASGVIGFYLISAILGKIGSWIGLAPYSVDGAYFYWIIPAAILINGAMALGLAKFFESFMPPAKRIIL